MTFLEQILKRRHNILSACLLASALCLCGSSARWMLSRQASKTKIIPSPRSTLLPHLDVDEVAALVYPPDLLPGGRNVETPYGTMRVFEWGPEDGEKVLLLHGVGTPAIALGQLAKELVRGGYRVMLFDFFGRGYSDAPADLPYDSRLYTSQILLALASSHLPWSGLSGFHLVGYSMGGGISVAFTRYFPHMVRSLTLICSSGLLRPSHVNWKFALLYTRTMLPEWLRAFIVKRRLLPEARHGKAAPEAEGAPRGARWGKGDSDASAGDAYDGAVLVEERPDATVAAVLAWHLVHHRGFLMAYMKSMRHAPLFNQQADWRTLGTILAKTRERKRDSSSVPPGSLLLDKVLLIMGESDPVIPKDEVVGDTLEVFGEDGIELLVLEGGHELPITKSAEVAAAVRAFGVRD